MASGNLISFFRFEIHGPTELVGEIYLGNQFKTKITLRTDLKFQNTTKLGEVIKFKVYK